MLFNEPKLLKSSVGTGVSIDVEVSVLFNEPKLLKSRAGNAEISIAIGSFSALQRAEIAEIHCCCLLGRCAAGFSALQRAEIAEIDDLVEADETTLKFQCSSTSRNC